MTRALSTDHGLSTVPRLLAIVSISMVAMLSSSTMIASPTLVTARTASRITCKVMGGIVFGNMKVPKFVSSLMWNPSDRKCKSPKFSKTKNVLRCFSYSGLSPNLRQATSAWSPRLCTKAQMFSYVVKLNGVSSTVVVRILVTDMSAALSSGPSPRRTYSPSRVPIAAIINVKSLKSLQKDIVRNAFQKLTKQVGWRSSFRSNFITDVKVIGKHLYRVIFRFSKRYLDQV